MEWVQAMALAMGLRMDLVADWEAMEATVAMAEWEDTVAMEAWEWDLYLTGNG